MVKKEIGKAAKKRNFGTKDVRAPCTSYRCVGCAANPELCKIPSPLANADGKVGIVTGNMHPECFGVFHALLHKAAPQEVDPNFGKHDTIQSCKKNPVPREKSSQRKTAPSTPVASHNNTGLNLQSKDESDDDVMDFDDPFVQARDAAEEERDVQYDGPEAGNLCNDSDDIRMDLCILGDVRSVQKLLELQKVIRVLFTWTIKYREELDPQVGHSTEYSNEIANACRGLFPTDPELYNQASMYSQGEHELFMSQDWGISNPEVVSSLPRSARGIQLDREQHIFYRHAFSTFGRKYYLDSRAEGERVEDCFSSSPGNGWKEPGYRGIPAPLWKDSPTFNQDVDNASPNELRSMVKTAHFYNQKALVRDTANLKTMQGATAWRPGDGPPSMRPQLEHQSMDAKANMAYNEGFVDGGAKVYRDIGKVHGKAFRDGDVAAELPVW